MQLPTIVIVDTTFARVNMGEIVASRIAASDSADRVQVRRLTVPGFKDLTAAARRAVNDGAALVVACGMPGPEPIDESCAQDASGGLQMVQALTGVPVLEVFVHMSEALTADRTVNEARLEEICRLRCEGHGDNAVWMTVEPETMLERAGTGRRQGAADEGPVHAGV